MITDFDLIPFISGFPNLGNTCYLNSILQCLSNSKPLTDFFINEFRDSYLDIENIERLKLYNLFYQLLIQHSINGNRIRPILSNFVSELINLSSGLLVIYRQEDCMEFLDILLNYFNTSRTYLAQRQITPEVFDIISLFKLRLKSNRCCPSNPQHVVERYNDDYCLKLPVVLNENKVINILQRKYFQTLEECLENFFKPSTIDDDYTCEHCNVKYASASASEQIFLHDKEPEILIIQLIRTGFATGRQTKISTRITIPDTLSLADYYAGEVINPFYELFAFTNHIGSTFQGGHYIGN